MDRKDVFICGAISAIVIGGCAGAVVGNISDPRYADSISRMVLLNRGMQMYCSDADDSTPLPNAWVDLLEPYVQNHSAFVSPAFDGMPGKYGYAMNVNTAARSVSSIDDPEHTPILFDSTDLSRNATTTPDTMPHPGRYEGSNTRAFVDGAVADEYPVLRTAFQESLIRVRQLGTGLLMYSSDYDDVTPTSHWMDSLAPYVKAERVFHSPLLDAPDEYGYAMNPEILGISLQAVPSETIAIFDSTDLRRNAVASLTTRPSPGRYNGRNTWVTIHGVAGSGP